MIYSYRSADASPLRWGLAGNFLWHFEKNLDGLALSNHRVRNKEDSALGKVHGLCSVLGHERFPDSHSQSSFYLEAPDVAPIHSCAVRSVSHEVPPRSVAVCGGPRLEWANFKMRAVDRCVKTRFCTAPRWRARGIGLKQPRFR